MRIYRTHFNLNSRHLPLAIAISHTLNDNPIRTHGAEHPETGGVSRRPDMRDAATAGEERYKTV